MSLQARSVLATLADTQFSLRTAIGISESVKLSLDFVTATLNEAKSIPENGIHRVWTSGVTVNNEPTYTLFSRRLPRYQSWPVIGPVARSLAGVNIG